MTSLVVFLAAAVVAVFWLISRSLRRAFRHTERRLRILNERADRRHEDVYWEHCRDYETLAALAFAFERAKRDQPERLRALLSDGAPLEAVIGGWLP